MVKMFLLVGPSGVGKSTALNKLKDEKFHCFNLDDEIKKETGKDLTELLGEGNLFLEKSKEIICAIEKRFVEKDFLLIDVGAGSTNKKESYNYFLEKNLIYLILNDADALFKRRPCHPSKKSYMDAELNPHKKKNFYDLIPNSNCINVKNMSKQEVADAIKKVVLTQKFFK